MKFPPLAWILRALHRPKPADVDAFYRAGERGPSAVRGLACFCLADQAARNSASGRAGARGGARAGKPICVSILTITAGSSMPVLSVSKGLS